MMILQLGSAYKASRGANFVLGASLESIVSVMK
jgi:hypothetical protein